MPEEEKTEEASQRRIDQARERGDVPKSRELNSAIALLLGLLTLRFFAQFSLGGLKDISVYTLTELNYISPDPQTLQVGFMNLLLRIMLIISPILIVTAVTGILTNFLQVGALFSFEALSFKFEKLNPISGLQQLFSRNSLVETLKAILKFTIIGVVVVLTIIQEALGFQTAGSKSMPELLTYLGGLTYKVGFRVALSLLLLSVIDFFYQRWSYAEKLKMSHQEVKEEQKETESSQEVRSLIRQRQMAAARQRMMQDVPEADVVITNPTHIAVAIVYDLEQSQNPIVTAKGAGKIAERIKEIAFEHNVPVVEDKPIAWALYEIELGDSISYELFQPVAEILARIYRTRDQKTA